jgi:hypothetical protein
VSKPLEYGSRELLAKQAVQLELSYSCLGLAGTAHATSQYSNFTGYAYASCGTFDAAGKAPSEEAAKPSALCFGFVDASQGAAIPNTSSSPKRLTEVTQYFSLSHST